MTEGEQLTTIQLIDRCGVTRKTIERWQQAGHIVSVGRVRVDNGWSKSFVWSDVRDWLIETDRWDDVADCPTGFYINSNGVTNRIERKGQKP